VIKGSSAEKAGLKTGDVITNVNGKSVKDREDLVNIIDDMKPGDETDVVYLREGKEKKIKAKLGESTSPKAWSWSMDQKMPRYEFHYDPPVASVGPMAPMPPMFNDHDMWIYRNDRP
jgi:membrane-associated protease RseP (regulator of RpoE activity)